MHPANVRPARDGDWEAHIASAEGFGSPAARYYDWRQDWRKAHLSERIAARKLRQNYKAGERKRIQAKVEMPPCPYCDQRDMVCRNGRQVNIVLPDRQRYHCRTCNRNFQGEEL